MKIMSIKDELLALDAPRAVRDAGDECQKCIDADIRPPASLVAFIQEWVGKARRQDRYGK
jgi:hypothetical protein